MGSNPLAGYNPILIAQSETTLGTTPTPADVASFAALALPTIKADLGPVQTPAVRAAQDRGLGRGMQNLFISGRQEAVPWNVMTALRTRSAVDGALRELALWKMLGFVITTNGGTSVVISQGNTPIESTDFAPATMTRILGRSPGEMELEVLAGCFAESLRIEGGDKEVLLTFAGQGQSKGVGTSIASITLANGVVTSVTISAEDSYALATGYYICESEIIFVTAPAAGATSATIARAQLGSTGVAHTAQPLYPYIPSGISYSGAPISEALTTTVTFDGTAFRCLNWSLDIKSGLLALPGETGSALPYQGVKATRFEATPSCSFVCKGDDVRKLNKARARKEIAVSFLQGSAVGGIITAAFPQCEAVGMKIEDNANDTVTVSGQLRCREVAAGNGMFTLTFT
jgi:hypothetical protein